MPRGLAASTCIYGESARVAKEVQLRIDGIGESLLLADVLEQSGAHAATEHCVEDVQRKAKFVGKRVSRHADRNMDLFERFLLLENDGREAFRNRTGKRFVS